VVIVAVVVSHVVTTRLTPTPEPAATQGQTLSRPAHPQP